VELLALLGRPVIVVLNQTGRPLPRPESAASEQVWREALRGAGSVGGVATLDAFTRCWPCELLLVDQAAGLLSGSKRSGAEEVRRALLARHLDIFRRSMRAIAGSVSEMAADGESAGRAGLLDHTRRVVARLVSGSAEQRALDGVHECLKTRLEKRSAQMMNDLIALHGLKGESVGRIMETQSADLATGEGPRLRLRDVLLAAAGGAGAGGALDAMVGGASMGAGLALGGLLGAMTAIGLGARGLAEAGDGRICWSQDALIRHLAVCLKSYLCVAHFGRGQGSWRDHDGPAAWGAVVEEVLRSRGDDVNAALRGGAEALARLCTEAGLEVLGRFYPGVELRGSGAAIARDDPLGDRAPVE
jgi:hypothetical protein